MALKYGIDLYTPTNQGDDPWKPAMKNQAVRVLFGTVDELFAYLDALKAGNRNLETRVVQVQDDETVYNS